MKSVYFLYLAAYFAILLAVGLAFSRKMRNLEDFFLASRNLSAGLIYLSLTAAWFGATSILVSTDEALRRGVSAFWIVGVPAVATVLILAIFLARPLHRLPIMTIPDLVELRYGRAVRHIASLLIIWYMIMLAASQMVAMGQFLKNFLGFPYGACLALGTAVVLIYSVSGGLRSVVFTDGVQFLLLMIGVCGLVIFLAGRTSWPEIQGLSSQPGRDGYFQFFHGFKENALMAFSFTLAWTISPIALQRIQAARNVRVARQGLFATAGTLFVLYGFAVLIGILSLPLFPGQNPSGPLVSEIIASSAGPVFGRVLFVAVLAAILSTMDTAVNTGALSLTRDVYLQFFRSPKVGPVQAGRLATLVVGVSAFLIAGRFQSILKTIGLSSEIMAEGLFVPGIAMIFMKKRFPMAGLLSLCLGGGFSIMSFLGEMHVLPLHLPVWPFSVPYGISLSLLGFGTGMALERVKKS